MNNNTYQTLYMQAIHGLMSGCVMPWEEDILSHSPLPDEFIDPYISRETDPRESMKLAYTAMAVWIDEAKKANYFTKRFVKLSKMIMNGVTLMGRGLVSLHARGEDLGDVPMSVQDLIGVASYHIRKSYLGVLQTAKSHPEVSERLLVNQLGWHNTLLRLYKTREKLNEKPKSKAEALPGAKTVDQGEIPAAESEPAAAALPAPKSRPMENLAEFFAPGALGASRAFRPLEGAQHSAGSCQQIAADPIKNSSEGTGNKIKQAGIKTESNEAKEKETKPGTEKNGTKPEKSAASAVDPEKEKKLLNESEAEKTEARTDDQNENEITANAPEPKNEESAQDLPEEKKKEIPPKEPGRDRDPGGASDPDRKNDFSENEKDRDPAMFPPFPSGTDNEKEDISDNTGPPDPESSTDPGERKTGSGDRSAPPVPAYYWILNEAERRGRREGGEPGTLSLTLDEIRLLLADPVFCTREHSVVPVLRQILGSQ